MMRLQRLRRVKIASFTYDFPKPGTKAPATKETLEARVGACL